MKFLSILTFAACAAIPTDAALPQQQDSHSFETELLGIQFEEWSKLHGKEYTCVHSKAKRFEVWKKNHGE